VPASPPIFRSSPIFMIKSRGLLSKTSPLDEAKKGRYKWVQNPRLGPRFPGLGGKWTGFRHPHPKVLIDLPRARSRKQSKRWGYGIHVLAAALPGQRRECPCHIHMPNSKLGTTTLIDQADTTPRKESRHDSLVTIIWPKSQRQAPHTPQNYKLRWVEQNYLAIR
jgi:hypothetical protein